MLLKVFFFFWWTDRLEQEHLYFVEVLMDIIYRSC